MLFRSKAKAEPTVKVAPSKPAPEPAPAAKPVAEPAASSAGADATELQTSGKRKLESGDLSGAIADLRASLQVRTSVQTQTLLGRAYFDHGDLAQAAKVLVAAGPNDEAMLLLGNVYQHQGNTNQARKTFEAFLQMHPNHRRAAWVRSLLQTL